MSDIETSGAGPVPEPMPEKRGFGSRIRTYFLTGLVVAGPLFITTYITWAFITWVDDLVRPMVPVAYRPETYLPWTLPGTGLVIAFLALTLLGFLTANLVGRTFVEIGEWFVERMPLVSSVYKGLKQVFETLFSGSGTTFRKVGLVQFPSEGQWSLVFLSQPPGAAITSKLPNQDEYVSVFLPCTPNPTTGFFFYVRRAEVVELDMTTEDAAKLIMSAGLIQPNGDHQGKLSALAQATRAMRAARDKHLPTPAK